MTASSSRFGLLAGAALAALLSAPLQAQDASNPADETGGPVSILPAPAPAPEEEPAPQGPAIDVGDLAAPGVDRIGLVDSGSGGFSAQLWRGTDLDLLRQVLPQLPRRVMSPAQRRLTQNLMLSPGAPPVSSTQADTLAASQWLLETRAQTLAATGDWPDVHALLELVPADQMTEGLRRLKAEAALITGNANAACNQARTALNAVPDVYWQKMQVFCQIRIEARSAAAMGLGLLREQKIEDAAFFWAADVLGGAQPPLPESVTRLAPLQYAMLRKANATLPANIADVQAKITDPATLAWLAALPLPEPDKADKKPTKAQIERRRAMEEARILMAERAVAAGTMDIEALRDIYRKVDVKNPAPPPLTQIKADDARGRALLFQSAQLQTVPTARAEVIALALDLVRADHGETGPDLLAMGRVYAPLLMGIEPAGDQIWFAGTAVRALLAAAAADKGISAMAAEKAKAWFDLARSMGRTSREAQQTADGLWPLEKLINGPGGETLTPEIAQAWAASLPQTLAPAVAAERREIMLTLLTALGEPVPAAAWLPVMGGPPKLDNARALAPHLWNGLSDAAKTRRVGETAVLALVALGEEGPGKTGAPALQHVIDSLRIVGRDADARALAVEAALVLGL